MNECLSQVNDSTHCAHSLYKLHKGKGKHVIMAFGGLSVGQEGPNQGSIFHVHDTFLPFLGGPYQRTSQIRGQCISCRALIGQNSVR